MDWMFTTHAHIYSRNTLWGKLIQANDILVIATDIFLLHEEDVYSSLNHTVVQIQNADSHTLTLFTDCAWDTTLVGAHEAGVSLFLVYSRKDPLLSTQVLSPDKEPAAREELCNLTKTETSWRSVHLFMYSITAELCWFVTCAQLVCLCLCFIFIHMWRLVNLCGNLSARFRVCVWTGVGPHQASGCCCLAGCPVASALVWSGPADPV